MKSWTILFFFSQIKKLFQQKAFSLGLICYGCDIMICVSMGDGRSGLFSGSSELKWPSERALATCERRWISSACVSSPWGALLGWELLVSPSIPTYNSASGHANRRIKTPASHTKDAILTRSNCFKTTRIALANICHPAGGARPSLWLPSASCWHSYIFLRTIFLRSGDCLQTSTWFEHRIIFDAVCVFWLALQLGYSIGNFLYPSHTWYVYKLQIS